MSVASPPYPHSRHPRCASIVFGRHPSTLVSARTCNTTGVARLEDRVYEVYPRYGTQNVLHVFTDSRNPWCVCNTTLRLKV